MFSVLFLRNKNYCNNLKDDYFFEDFLLFPKQTYPKSRSCWLEAGVAQGVNSQNTPQVHDSGAPIYTKRTINTRRAEL